ncbi:hypothetical protein TNCV_1319711 [Trichonephila clavipes]|nr:hypothetical protein TNCV_1319711 [Trichonephila clavipes]
MKIHRLGPESNPQPWVQKVSDKPTTSPRSRENFIEDSSRKFCSGCENQSICSVHKNRFGRFRTSGIVVRDADYCGSSPGEGMDVCKCIAPLRDEAHFWLNGYVNKQNCRIWSEANPQGYVETPLHPEKLTVWCALWAGGILLQKR